MQPDTDIRAAWGRAWPGLLAVGTVGAVGVPAAVASYRHARDVVAAHGDPVMAPWLPLSVDGMLVAALVVIWVRRHRGDPAGAFPWCAFCFGMVVTVLANLAAVREPSPVAVAVALFPPLALAVTLELVALIAYRSAPSPAATGAHGPSVIDRIDTAAPGAADDDPAPRDWWAEDPVVDDDQVLDDDAPGAAVAAVDGDPRVQDLARRLAAGEDLTGAAVGELFAVSARTGRRLIEKASDHLQNGHDVEPGRLALVPAERGA